MSPDVRLSYNGPYEGFDFKTKAEAWEIEDYNLLSELLFCTKALKYQYFLDREDPEPFKYKIIF